MGFSLRFGRAIGTPLYLSLGTQVPFPGATVILGFLSVFNGIQASSPSEALNSKFLSNFQRHVRPPVEMRRGTTAFSKVSTGDSDIPSPCEIQDDPAFQSLQGNPALFRVRASRCPFQLGQHTQDLSYIPIAEKLLVLRCCRKLAFM